MASGVSVEALEEGFYLCTVGSSEYMLFLVDREYL